MSRRLEEMQEWRADTEAVGADPRQALVFSRVLLDQVGQERDRLAVQGMAAVSGKELERRVRRLLVTDPSPQSTRWKRRCCQFLVMVGVPVCLGGATMLIAEEENGTLEKRATVGGVDLTQLALASSSRRAFPRRCCSRWSSLERALREMDGVSGIWKDAECGLDPLCGAPRMGAFEAS